MATLTTRINLPVCVLWVVFHSHYMIFQHAGDNAEQFTHIPSM